MSLIMNRPAEVGKLLTSRLGAIRVNLRCTERLLEEAIVGLRESDDNLLVFHFCCGVRGRAPGVYLQCKGSAFI